MTSAYFPGSVLGTNQTVTCAHCEKTTIRGHTKQKYCNHWCAAEANRLRQIAAGTIKGPPKPRPCETCGTEFTPKKYHIAKFCSDICVKRAREYVAPPPVSEFRVILTRGPDGTMVKTRVPKKKAKS
jgi:hypothetical protein